jgi:hypothetical protein
LQTVAEVEKKRIFFHEKLLSDEKTLLARGTSEGFLNRKKRFERKVGRVLLPTTATSMFEFQLLAR